MGWHTQRCPYMNEFIPDWLIYRREKLILIGWAYKRMLMKQVVVDLLNGLDVDMVTIHVYGYGKICLFLGYVK